MAMMNITLAATIIIFIAVCQGRLEDTTQNPGYGPDYDGGPQTDTPRP